MARDDIERERTGTRLGWTTFLGAQAVSAGRPLQWVRQPDHAAAVIAWSRAAYQLQACPGIECGSLTLGRRVREAFARPLGARPITVVVDGIVVSRRAGFALATRDGDRSPGPAAAMTATP